MLSDKNVLESCLFRSDTHLNDKIYQILLISLSNQHFETPRILQQTLIHLFQKNTRFLNLLNNLNWNQNDLNILFLNNFFFFIQEGDQNDLILGIEILHKILQKGMKNDIISRIFYRIRNKISELKDSKYKNNLKELFIKCVNLTEYQIFTKLLTEQKENNQKIINITILRESEDLIPILHSIKYNLDKYDQDLLVNHLTKTILSIKGNVSERPLKIV